MNLFCIEFSEPHWISVIQKITNKMPVNLVYWTGSVEYQAKIEKLFPSVVFHDSLLAVRGLKPIKWSPKNQYLIDASLLAKLEPYHLTAIKMMERMDLDRKSFIFEHRLRHYYKLVEYWYTVISEFKPDAVLMPISPHLVYDYVIYSICKVIGIPTLFFDRTGIPGLVLPVNSITDGQQKLFNRYKYLMVKKDRQPLNDAIQTYLAHLKSDYSSGMAPNFRLKLERYAAQFSLISKLHLVGTAQMLKSEFKTIISHFLNNGLSVPRNYLVRKGRPPDKSKIGLLSYFFLKWHGIYRKNRLLKFYERFKIESLPNCPYIFVALHYQPERNTIPIGGVFADQVMLVKHIASCLPKGWKILVKEHYWQLHPSSKGQSCRDQVFYRDLLEIPSVKLVSICASSFDLIDGAVAVATVSGSVGWEAINRGKPALVFGEAWYQYCEGAYRIRSIADCQHAIARIQEVGGPLRDLVHCFVAAVNDVGIPAVLEPKLEVSGGINPEMNIHALSESYIERLRGIRLN